MTDKPTPSSEVRHEEIVGGTALLQHAKQQTACGEGHDLSTLSLGGCNGLVVLQDGDLKSYMAGQRVVAVLGLAAAIIAGLLLWLV